MVNQNNILPRVLPFAIYIFFLALSDYLPLLLNSLSGSFLSFDSKWLYLVRVLLVLSVLLYYWRDYVELATKPAVVDFLYAVLAGLLVFLLWILPYPTWAGVNNHFKTVGIAQDVLWLSSRLIGAALIVPVMEEIFWRSLVMRWIDNKNFLNTSPKNISLYALVLSSGLFASAHHLWLAGLLAGLVYGAMYMKYKNLWIPVVAHAVTNGVLGLWVMLTGHWQYW
ncbi:CAAX prenyl protease-related protein [Methylotenera sp.]|uniref:CAAX prenyl protease-related protein n=1 Tax=Methylotenera sp. TaxID=2051956 RepID=UPI0024878069|nr:CAAX prenyl protease-related protein [Methylotenera sp.]MDI1299009.1 CAAX prenyl protease-related protein [Methylotenera sp.]